MEIINTQNAVTSSIAMSVDDAMKALSLSRPTIYQLLKQGCFKSCKIGRRRLILTQSIHDHLNAIEEFGL
jgi:excisionase family DNA binding protein